MSKAAADAATWYQRTFHGKTDQISRIRREIARHLEDCPAADDVVLVASELAANSVVHSASAGEFFTVRCEAYPDYVWVEVEDLGGPWRLKPPDDRPHGLDIVTVLAGPDNWGTETTSNGNRIVWARLDLPRQARPDPGRPHDISALTSAELGRARRELAGYRRQLENAISSREQGHSAAPDVADLGDGLREALAEAIAEQDDRAAIAARNA